MFLAMHINNQKLGFDIFTVWNIFIEHDLNILMIFVIKEKCIILSYTNSGLCSGAHLGRALQMWIQLFFSASFWDLLLRGGRLPGGEALGRHQVRPSCTCVSDAAADADVCCFSARSSCITWSRGVWRVAVCGGSGHAVLPPPYPGEHCLLLTRFNAKLLSAVKKYDQNTELINSIIHS